MDIGVSILVLVDVGLRHGYVAAVGWTGVSFNPCFSGCWSSTTPGYPFSIPYLCFNPCFSGCWSSTRSAPDNTFVSTTVSILVLVDVGLRQKLRASQALSQAQVSILVLVDVGLRQWIILVI